MFRDRLTHLVVKDQGTKKIQQVKECQREGEIKVVKSEWMLECLMKGIKVNEEDFALGLIIIDG